VAFKLRIFAVGKEHSLPPFGFGLGLAVYRKNPFHGETDLGQYTSGLRKFL
jgi:hypothetical protein